MTKKWTWISVVVALIIFIVVVRACTGGGGEHSQESPVEQAVPETNTMDDDLPGEKQAPVQIQPGLEDRQTDSNSSDEIKPEPSPVPSYEAPPNYSPPETSDYPSYDQYPESQQFDDMRNPMADPELEDNFKSMPSPVPFDQQYMTPPDSGDLGGDDFVPPDPPTDQGGELTPPFDEFTPPSEPADEY